MALVNRTLKNLIAAGSVFLFTAPICLAADNTILPPPPPDEDLPKPPERKVYVHNYDFKKVDKTLTRVIATPVTVQTTTTTSVVTTTPVETAPLTPVAATPVLTPPLAATWPAARPPKPAVKVLLDRAYVELGRGAYPRARDVLVSAVRLDSNDVSSRRYLAYSLVRTDQPSDALSQLLFLSKMARPSAFDLYTSGEAYLAIGNSAQAIDSFREAIKLDANMDAARGGLIRAYATAGKYQDAVIQCSEGSARTRNPRVQQYYRSLMAFIADAKTKGIQAPVYVPMDTHTGLTQIQTAPTPSTGWQKVLPNP